MTRRELLASNLPIDQPRAMGPRAAGIGRRNSARLRARVLTLILVLALLFLLGSTPGWAQDSDRQQMQGLDQHLGLGAGYDFTDFSGDLTDLGYDYQGAFINFIGTM